MSCPSDTCNVVVRFRAFWFVIPSARQFTETMVSSLAAQKWEDHGCNGTRYSPRFWTRSMALHKQK
jgi:hypothetical protein